VALKAARIVGHKPGNISLTPVKRHDASEITSTRLITVSAETRRHKQIFVMSALFILLSPFSAARALDGSGNLVSGARIKDESALHTAHRANLLCARPARGNLRSTLDAG